MSNPPLHKSVEGSGVWEHFTVRDGLPDMKIQCLLEDRQGNLWIGTEQRGVGRFDGDRFEAFTTRDGLSGNWVISVLEDREGALWFGTDGGLTRYDGGTFQPMYPKSGERYGIALNELYILGFSDIRAEIVRIIDTGDGWVVSEVVFTGTDDGPYFGIPATGRSMVNRAVWISRYDESGLMMNSNFYFDNLSVLVQIGVVPPPGATTVSPSTWGAIKATFQE